MDFDFDEYQPDSDFINTVWRTRSEQVNSFMSRAVSHWELVITKQRGKTAMSLVGPITRAYLTPVPPNAEFLGIQLKHGRFMPNFQTDKLVNAGLELPKASGNRFWLNGAATALPDFDHADVFVERLVRDGSLVKDPVVEAVLQDEPVDLSLRTVQRRFLKATGLTYKAIQQIERVEKATNLLQSGVAIADVIYQTGYADQPHLTRSLKQLIGQTPAQILKVSK
mgnify:CR=1 FL=1